jgi:hypothetical protein
VGLPEAVQRLKRNLSNEPEFLRELGSVADKLLRETPALKAMWQAIASRSDPRDPWVMIFLSAAKGASELPAFYYKPGTERRKLSSDIERAPNRLTRLIEENGLDAHVIYSNGVNFNGFYVYEGFGESNRARIDATEAKKLAFTQLIKFAACYAQERIAEVRARGKSRRNVRAIRFARLLAENNNSYYAERLLAVTAAGNRNGIHSTGLIVSAQPPGSRCN